MQSIKMASIPGPTVQGLESRLKKELLAEATACGGRVLVHREPSRDGAANAASTQHHNWAQTDDTHTAPVIEPFWCALTGHGYVSGY